MYKQTARRGNKKKKIQIQNAGSLRYAMQMQCRTRSLQNLNAIPLLSKTIVCSVVHFVFVCMYVRGLFKAILVDRGFSILDEA